MTEETRPAPGEADGTDSPPVAPASTAHATPRPITRASSLSPPVRLEVYEGPLDLLLDLIRKQEINIYDIPIAKITHQYLDYLRQNLEKLDTEVAGEFLLMAATLIHIKSKMLLPPDPNAESEEEDPRAELVHQLLEHEKFKQAAQMLQQKQVVQGAMW